MALLLGMFFGREAVSIGANGPRCSGTSYPQLLFVIPGWRASTRPQMCKCTSGNLEIPGSLLRIAPE
jgi:hypothetical protein